METAFTEEDLALEKGVINQEIGETYDDSEFVVYDEFSRRFWPNSTLGLPVFGTKDSVASFSSAMVAERLREILSGARIVIGAAGNVDPELVISFAEKWFGHLPRGERPTSKKITSNSGVVLVPRDDNQAYVILGRRWPDVHSEDSYAGEIFSTIIGEGMSSRLFQTIREKHGLAYDVGSEIDSYRESGAFLVNASVEPKNLPRALQLIVEIHQELREQSIGEGEFRRAIQLLTAQLDMECDDLEARLWRAIETEIEYGYYESSKEVAEKFAACTLDEIHEFIKKWLVDEHLLAVLGGDVGELTLPDEFIQVYGSNIERLNNADDEQDDPEEDKSVEDKAEEK